MTRPIYFDWKDMCHTYLGVVPPKHDAIVGSTIKLKWLCDNKPPLPQQLETHCKAYILGLIWGVLMPDKIGNKFHLMCLTLLTILRHAGRYS